jgi:hypothetical protein
MKSLSTDGSQLTASGKIHFHWTPSDDGSEIRLCKWVMNCYWKDPFPLAPSDDGSEVRICGYEPPIQSFFVLVCG